MSCSTSRIANPRSSWTSRRVWASAAVSVRSRPDDGSSRSTRRGWVISARPDLDEPSLAEAQPLDGLVGEVAQAEQVEHLVGALHLVGSGLAEQSDVAANDRRSRRRTRSAIDQVVADGGVGEELDALEGPTDPEAGPLVDTEPRDVVAVELDDAAVGAAGCRGCS